MKYFAHIDGRPFHLDGYKDCWIVQNDTGIYYLVRLAEPAYRISYQPMSWDYYEELLADIGMEVSGIGSFTLYPEELQVDEGL